MNIFKINKNMACNIFSFFGYLYLIALIHSYKPKYYGTNFIAYSINFSVFALVIIILSFLYVSEKNKYPNKETKINTEYKGNKYALTYFYTGIILHIIIIFIALVIFPNETQEIFTGFLYH